MRFIGLLAVLLGWSLLAQAESLDTVQVPVDGRGDAQRQDACLLYTSPSPRDAS